MTARLPLSMYARGCAHTHMLTLVQTSRAHGTDVWQGKGSQRALEVDICQVTLSRFLYSIGPSEQILRAFSHHLLTFGSQCHCLNGGSRAHLLIPCSLPIPHPALHHLAVECQPGDIATLTKLQCCPKTKVYGLPLHGRANSTPQLRSGSPALPLPALALMNTSLQ